MKYELTANRLRKAMKTKGLTQQALSNLSGVTKYSISHYVNGKNVPDNFQAFKLAKVLDCDPAWLMGTDEQNYIVVENTELQKKLAQLDEAQTARVLKYVNKFFQGGKS